jgi:hypothetical protein
MSRAAASRDRAAQLPLGRHARHLARADYVATGCAPAGLRHLNRLDPVLDHGRRSRPAPPRWINSAARGAWHTGVADESVLSLSHRWLIVLAVFFVLPYALVMAELGSTFAQEGGP